MTNTQKHALNLALGFVRSHHSYDCDGSPLYCGGCKTKQAIEKALSQPCKVCKGTGKTHFLNDKTDYTCEFCNGTGIE